MAVRLEKRQFGWHDDKGTLARVARLPASLLRYFGSVLVLVVAAHAAAEPVVLSGYEVDVLVSGSPVEIRDAAFSPGGVFGSEFFFVTTHFVFAVAGDGTATPYHSSSSINGGLSRIAFTEGGAFGSFVYLNAEDPPVGIGRIDPVTRQSVQGLATINEGTALAYSEGGPLGEYLYAGQAVGGGFANQIRRVAPNFSVQSFTNFGPNQGIVDMEIATGGTFGNYIYATLRSDPSNIDLVRIDHTGQVETFYDGQLDYIAFSPGGSWGDFLYATNAGGDIVRIDGAGNSTVFATGVVGRSPLAFASDGSGLYVAQSNSTERVLLITAVPEPSSVILAVIGMAIIGMWLRSSRFRSK